MYFIFVLAFVSCGGGGSDPIEFSDLVGVYALNSFRVEYDDGTSFDESDVVSFSGAFSIDASGNMLQVITVNGETISGGGMAQLLDGDTLNIISSDCTYEMDVSLNGNQLRTTVDHPCNQNYRETDLWVKTESSSLIKGLADANQNVDWMDALTPGAGLGELFY